MSWTMNEQYAELIRRMMYSIPSEQMFYNNVVAPSRTGHYYRSVFDHFLTQYRDDDRIGIKSAVSSICDRQKVHFQATAYEMMLEMVFQAHIPKVGHEFDAAIIRWVIIRKAQELGDTYAGSLEFKALLTASPTEKTLDQEAMEIYYRWIHSEIHGDEAIKAIVDIGYKRGNYATSSTHTAVEQRKKDLKKAKKSRSQ